MVCRTCQPRVYLTMEQSIVYAMATVLIFITAFVGVFVNQILRKKQKKVIKAVKENDKESQQQQMETYNPSHIPEDELSQYELEASLENDKTKTSPTETDVVYTMNGSDFQTSVGNLARNAGTHHHHYH